MSNLDTTSWSLIRRAAAGDAEDRERFAARYAPVIRGYFSTRWHLPLSHERVQDASQEVFVQCFRQGGVLASANPELGSGFQAFLYGVARRIGANLDRRLGHLKAKEIDGHSDFDECAISSELALSKSFDRAWASLVAREAGDLARARAEGHAARLAGLEALQLQFFEGLQPREIAERRGVAAEAIYESLRLAKKDFRAAFVEVMATYNPHCTEAELKQKCIDLVAHL
ncbi:MAG: DNA-directed RNA polymerase specialized sigma24 family protein [Planctomycetota bacterium]